MQSSKEKRNTGFTLIELLVVIAIIAVLISILMPALSKARSQAKLVKCASNQRQVIIAVNMYQTEWREIPPTIQAWDNGATDPATLAWTRPTRLNYHTVIGQPGLAGGSMYKILGSTLQEPGVFSCPMAPFTTDSLYPDEVNGGMATYDELYRTGNNSFLDASYWMLWNFHGFDNQLSDKPHFVGPGTQFGGKNSKNTLLLCDSLFRPPGAGAAWQSSHPLEGGNSVNTGLNVYYELYDSEFAVPDVNLNAGYLDGRVERVNSYNTTMQNLYPWNPPYQCYIPRNFQ